MNLKEIIVVTDIESLKVLSQNIPREDEKVMQIFRGLKFRSVHSCVVTADI
jgi:hypothetical protein